MSSKINIDITKLHPYLRFKLQKAIKKLDKKGMSILVTNGYRSFAEQNKLYAQGRTTKGKVVTNAKGGYSQHNYGIAIDIAMNYDVDGDGQITDDTWNEKGFRNVAKIMKSCGLAWGGDWKSFKDTPHFYLDKWGSTTEKLRAEFGSYNAIKNSWTKKTNDIVVMYSKKSTKSDKIATIPKGTKVEVCYIGKLGYSLICYKTEYGYIKNKYIE